MSTAGEEPIQELILPGVVEEPSLTKPKAAAPEDEENVSLSFVCVSSCVSDIIIVTHTLIKFLIYF